MYNKTVQIAFENNSNIEYYSSNNKYTQNFIEGYVEVFFYQNIFRLHYLRYFESKLICSFYGYKHATLKTNQPDSLNKKFINFAETVFCEKNSTNISSCKLIQEK